MWFGSVVFLFCMVVFVWLVVESLVVGFLAVVVS